MESDIHISNQYIDNIMAEYGYEWYEPDLEYRCGELSVPGDFASSICRKIKGLEMKLNETNN